jgi:catechol 2,3-dioxygenase-like lactoylglutathione lyase family enzyme
MLDHTGFAVTDLGRSKDFYIRALAPLSIELLAEVTAEQTGGGSRGVRGGRQAVLLDWRWRSCCRDGPCRIHRTITSRR